MTSHPFEVECFPPGEALGAERPAKAASRCRDADFEEGFWDGCFEVVWTELVRRVHGWGLDRWSAEELAQDAMVEGFLRRERFRGSWRSTSSVLGWVQGIAKNLRIDRYRRRIGRIVCWSQDALDELPRESATGTTNVEAVVALDRAMEELRQHRPLDQRCICQHHLEGRSIRVLAQDLGIEPGAMRVRLHRARARLGHYLDLELTAGER